MITAATVNVCQCCTVRTDGGTQVVNIPLVGLSLSLSFFLSFIHSFFYFHLKKKTSPTFLRCVDVENGKATCQSSACDGDQLQVPSTTTFTTETSCVKYQSYAMCYATTGTTCISDLETCPSGSVHYPDQFTYFATEQDCLDEIPTTAGAFLRCRGSSTSLGPYVKCRYEKCSNDEVMVCFFFFNNVINLF